MNAKNSSNLNSQNQIFIDSAPSNIALVKYMGKSNSLVNQASNSSLSYTLDYLKSEVAVARVTSEELEILKSKLKDLNISNLNNTDLMSTNTSVSRGSYSDLWIPWSTFTNHFQIKTQFAKDMHLSAKGLQKFMNHWFKCREQFAPYDHGHYVLSSINHFPSDCGLASSASSFAALTKTAHKVFVESGILKQVWPVTKLAMLSREGSGSSCRSFESPFVVWRDQEVFKLETPYKNLHHIVVIVNEHKKEVSSSEAHLRVKTSLLNNERDQRANVRTQNLITALQEKNWKSIFEITWADFWDMHVLFETSQPPFYYMEPESLKVLRWAQAQWTKLGDGPLVTMDAGANVHLLYRPDQMQTALEHYQELQKSYKLYSNI